MKTNFSFHKLLNDPKYSTSKLFFKTKFSPFTSRRCLSLFLSFDYCIEEIKHARKMHVILTNEIIYILSWYTTIVLDLVSKDATI